MHGASKLFLHLAAIVVSFVLYVILVPIFGKLLAVSLAVSHALDAILLYMLLIVFALIGSLSCQDRLLVRVIVSLLSLGSLSSALLVCDLCLALILRWVCLLLRLHHYGLISQSETIETSSEVAICHASINRKLVNRLPFTAYFTNFIHAVGRGVEPLFRE